jgi:hypothetical protein
MARTPEDTVLPAPRRRPPGVLSLLAWSAAALCLLPMFAVAFAALTGGWEVTGRLAETVLPRYAGTTAILVCRGPWDSDHRNLYRMAGDRNTLPRAPHP